MHVLISCSPFISSMVFTSSSFAFHLIKQLVGFFFFFFLWSVNMVLVG